MKTMRYLGFFLAIVAGIFVIVFAVSGWTAALVSIAESTTPGNAMGGDHFGGSPNPPKE
jgi:hypothetical protein